MVKKSDPIWFEDYEILYKNDRYLDFFPSVNMSLSEKINAITRLGIYIGVALYIAVNKYVYLYIPIIISSFCYMIYNSQPEKFININIITGSDTDTSVDGGANKDKKTLPTENNPLMNIDLIGDKRDKPPAVKSHNNVKVQDKIEDNFNKKLYRNVGDLYGKNNSQRQFVTMPSTTIPNEQTSYAKWLYGTGSTCKEDGVKCAPQWDPNQ